jgi:hypothetical protein
MYEQHNDTGATRAADEAKTKLPRAPWQRPSLRAMPARDAEVGVAVNTSDGAFTTS